MGGFEVLVDETTLVGLANRRSDPDRKAQETSNIHGLAEQPLEGLAPGILEHQVRGAALARKLQCAHRPVSVQFIPQPELMREPIQAGGGWLLRGRQQCQRRAPFPAAIRAPSSAE
jgi:hypothetical protein